MSATQLQNKINVVGTPVFCSACHGQWPDRIHVDFDAACDRGYGESEGIQINMDDLILCEECLRDGARQIGMVDGETWQSERELLRERLAEMSERAQRAEHELEVTDGALARFIEPAKARKRHEDAVARGRASAESKRQGAKRG